VLELTDQEKELAQEVAGKWTLAERSHNAFRKKCDHLYALWAGYSSWKNDMAQANPRDRDVGLVDAKREWGAELFIPIVFATVESVIPRMLSNRPRMLILPTDLESDRNVQNMKYLIDRQQEQIDYELICQDVAKDGQVYGLGVQKTYWKTQQCAVPTLEQVMYEDRWVPGRAQMRPTFDDPWAEAIDPRDFVWDPYGHDLETCSFVFHRTWRTTRYVMRMIQSGAWLKGHEGVTEDDIKKLAANRWSENRAAQLRASGQPVPGVGEGEQPHEVWEFHDGERIVTVLDRETPVQAGANLPEARGGYIFQAFRPSKRPAREMAGMGIVEPTEDLQREMNTMRSQRRDNATAVLQKTYAYQQGLVEPEDLRFGPAVAIPVNGDPKEVLFPIPQGDIPNSSYNEEDRLIADMARASGMDDSSQGLANGQATATEVQYVQAAASLRIQMQTRRFEMEVIKASAVLWVRMNQFRIRGVKALRVPLEDPAEADTVTGPNQWWKMVELTPPELMGEFAVDVDGGSTQPDNVPQKRGDGQALASMALNNPNINQQVAWSWILDRFDVKAPQEWLAVAPHIPPNFLPLLERALTTQMHLDPASLQQLIAQVMQAASQQEQAAVQNPQGATQVQSAPPPQLAAQNGNGSGPADA
jgi:hypothetical protein